MSHGPAWSWLRRTPELAGELTIAVLYGGRSSEREVSLVSGSAVLEALRQTAGPQPKRVLDIEIQADGRWSIDGSPRWPQELNEHIPRGTVFLIALHGGEGEGGSIQGFLKTCGFAHTGESVAASSLALDKVRSRWAAQQAGIRVAPGTAFTSQAWRAERAAQLAAVGELGPGPWFAKPSLGGSSVSMCRASSLEALSHHLDQAPALDAGELWLVEQSIPGIEATQGLLASDDVHQPHALPVVEIRPQQEGWFDFQEKYSAHGAEETCPPATLSAPSQTAIRQCATRLWTALGLQSYARMDFIVPDDGPPVFLEANTLPGFTARSLFPLAAGVEGLSYRDLCLELCLRAQGSPEAQP